MIIIAAIFLFVFFVLIGSISVEGADCCDDPITGGKGTVLYLDGGDPSSGSLDKEYPAKDDYETSTINPDGATNRQHLGQWTSDPLVYDWTIDSLIEVQIPAWGNGYSASTQFFVDILLDGESLGEIVTADDGLMPMYMYWLGNDTFSFTAAAGQTIGVDVYVMENGPGGELRYDSRDGRAQIWIRTTSVLVEVSDTPLGGAHESSIDAFSYWGENDIDYVGILLMDPAMMNGGPVWDDIVNNATLWNLTDDLTVSWDDSKAGDGHRYGTWKWNMPDETPNVMEAVGFANDTGISVGFNGALIQQRGGGGNDDDDDTNSVSVTNDDDVPWMFIIGLMLVAGICIAGYQSKILEHDFKRIAVVAGTTIIVGIIVMSTFYSAAFSTDKQSAPDFTLKTIDDKEISLEDLEDKIVVLSFSGITCSFCEPQMEEMAKVRERLRGNDDVFFLSVNIMGGDDDADWLKFKNELNADWDFAMDNDGLVGKFKIYTMPVIVIIDKEGYVVYTHKDTLLKADELENEIQDVEDGIATGGLTFTGGSLMFAFFVGITAFFAPCAFPLLPGFMTYQLGRMKSSEGDIGGYYDDDGFFIEDDPEIQSPGIMKGLMLGLAAMIGITAVMVVFALFGWLFEDAIQSNMKVYTPVLGLVIVVLGIVFLLHIPLPTGNLRERITSSRLYERTFGSKIESWQMEDASNASLHFGIMAYGAGYASASMGCHGPIFIAVLLIGMAGGFLLTLEMILLYALGMGMCMVIVCILVAGAEDAVIDKLQSRLPMINKVSGLFLIVAGIWIFWTGYQAYL